MFFFIILFYSITVIGFLDEKDVKKNYSKIKFIENVNYSLFGYLGYILIQFIIFLVKIRGKPDNTLIIILRNKIYYFLSKIIHGFILLLKLCFFIIYCIKSYFFYKILGRHPILLLIYDIIIFYKGYYA